jgi:hypothetical protein
MSCRELHGAAERSSELTPRSATKDRARARRRARTSWELQNKAENVNFLRQH